MGKISSSKEQSFKRKTSHTVMSSNSLSDAADSNSDSGLDVEIDSESRDEANIHEPLLIFKNPSITSYEHVMGNLHFPLLQSQRARQDSEPPSKKAKRGIPLHSGGKVLGPMAARRPNHSFGVQPSPPTNYADFLLEEANLGFPNEDEELPHLQTVLKSIFREENGNAARDLMTAQTKAKNSAKSEIECLQMDSTPVENNVSRTGPTTTSSNGPSRRVPLGRRQLTLCLNLPSKSKNGKMELRILSQPEEQHRARYLTEGSRGAVKDRIGSGYPTVKLFGFCKPVTLQVFIGTDQGKVQPHLFYQASKVCGKNSAPCTQKKIEGTVVLEMSLLPEKDMTLSCDCVGILKERNVDVEQRLLHFGGTRNKKRSTKCRLIFRALVVSDDGSVEILQAASASIVCTQPPGIPEICRKSVSESLATGNVELFVIGKNFLKDTKVLFEECSRDAMDDSSLASNPENWKKIVLPEKDFLQPNHLICTVPPFRDPTITRPVRVRLLVQSSGKRSEPQNFTYLPISHAGCAKGSTTITHSTSNSVLINQEHSQGSVSTDTMPPLLRLPMAQQNSSVDQSTSLKQEERTLITTVVIPDGSQGLSPSATAHILQDTQQALQSVANSGLGLPIKTSHIQVLVMPASSTVSVTSSPDSTSTPLSLQNSILNCLKSEIPSDILNACESQESMHKLQQNAQFNELMNQHCHVPEAHYSSNNFLEPSSNSRLNQFSDLGTQSQTIRDLLMKDQVKIESSVANSLSFRNAIINSIPNVGGKVEAVGCPGMSLQNSLQNGLGCSLESIPMHSFMQSKNSSLLQGPKLDVSEFAQNCNLGNAPLNGTYLLSDAKPLNQEANFNVNSRLDGNNVCVPICSSSSFNLAVNCEVKQDTGSCTTDPRMENCPPTELIHVTNFECLNSQVNSLLKEQSIQAADQIRVSTSNGNLQFNTSFSEQEQRLLVQNTLNDIAKANSEALMASNASFVDAGAPSVSNSNQIQFQSGNTGEHNLCNSVCISDGSVIGFAESSQQSPVSTTLAMSTASLHFENQFRISVPKPSTQCITTYSLTEPTFYYEPSFNAPQKLISNVAASKDMFQLNSDTCTQTTLQNTTNSPTLTTSSAINAVPSMSLTRDFLEPEIRSAFSSLISISAASTCANTQASKNIENTIVQSQSSLDFEPKFSTTSVFPENVSVAMDFMSMQSNSDLPNVILENKYQLAGSTVGNIQTSPGKMLDALDQHSNNQVVQDQNGLFSTASETDVSASKSTNNQQSTTSIDQMSTMMSLLPETELLKLINPSTFDKI